MSRRGLAGGLAIALLLALPALAGCGGGGEGSTAKGEPKASTSRRGASSEDGGDRSIEGFGGEATGSSRRALVGAFHSYLSALSARRYRAACGHLASRVRGSLAQLPSAGSAGRSCAATLAHLFSPSAAAVARGQASGKIARVRVRDDLGFVVFRGPEGSLYQLPLAREHGAWKASVATPSILAPSRASLES